MQGARTNEQRDNTGNLEMIKKERGMRKKGKRINRQKQGDIGDGS